MGLIEQHDSDAALRHALRYALEPPSSPSFTTSHQPSSTPRSRSRSPPALSGGAARVPSVLACLADYQRSLDGGSLGDWSRSARSGVASTRASHRPRAEALRPIGATVAAARARRLREAVFAGDEAAVVAVLADDGAHTRAAAAADAGTITSAVGEPSAAASVAALCAAGRVLHSAAALAILPGAAGDRAASVLGAICACGANPDAPDELGLTPLHVAAAVGSTAAVAVLLRAGARADARSDGGSTPLDLGLLRARLVRAAAVAAAVEPGSPPPPPSASHHGGDGIKHRYPISVKLDDGDAVVELLLPLSPLPARAASSA